MRLRPLLRRASPAPALLNSPTLLLSLPPFQLRPPPPQVDKMAEAVPDNLRAYWYTALSLLGGATLGIAIYGWSVWAG